MPAEDIKAIRIFAHCVAPLHQQNLLILSDDHCADAQSAGIKSLTPFLGDAPDIAIGVKQRTVIRRAESELKRVVLYLPKIQPRQLAVVTMVTSQFLPQILDLLLHFLGEFEGSVLPLHGNLLWVKMAGGKHAKNSRVITTQRIAPSKRNSASFTSKPPP